MPFDLHEYNELRESNRMNSAAMRKRELTVAARASVSASQVTGDKHWDLFLSILQGRLNRIKESLEVALDLLKSSDDFSPEAMINQKIAVRLFGREIEVLEWVIGLPKEVMEQGDHAKQLLRNIEESSH